MDYQPDWVSGGIYGNISKLTPAEKNSLLKGLVVYNFKGLTKGDDPIQQSDLLKPFLLDVCQSGFDFAFSKFYSFAGAASQKANGPFRIIVVGAGMSGLVAAYELVRAGHDVIILERQHRVGGRVKTIGESHFHKGLWTDSGAMRLPGDGMPHEHDDDGIHIHHYLTDFYAQKFQLPVKKFINSSDESYYMFQGKPRIRKREWKSMKGEKCSEYWPGWDVTLTEGTKQKFEIQDIMDYFDATTKPLVSQLCKWLEEEPSTAWGKWIGKWSQFSVEAFLTSEYKDIVSRLGESDASELESLKYLLPWPPQAVTALSTFDYTLPLNVSLVWYVSNDIGLWWKDPMHTYEDGVKMLPEAFLKHLDKNLVYGANVYKIEYKENLVRVFYRNETTGKETELEGAKVIVTLPANIIRQLEFSPPLPPEYRQAIANVKTNPLIKTSVQTRTRFWQADGIHGGISKTDLDIGQVVYQSNPDFETPDSERGLLMCYTWRPEPGLHTMEEKEAIAKVVHEISQLHPEITDEFEVGVRQAWADNPEGAYCILKPEEYINIMRCMMYPYKSLYFAGEAFSYANGWIQGALESGLRAAYQAHVYS